MDNHCYPLLCYFVVLIVSSYAAEIPDFIGLCKKEQLADLDCVAKAGDTLKPYLAAGVPEYHIPSIEPLLIKDLLTENIGTLHLFGSDIKVWGCSNYEIKDFHIDLEKQTYEITTLLPVLNIEAHYNISGKVLVMPIKGDGPLSANLTNVLSKIIFQGELYDKDGAKYLKYTDMKIATKAGGGIIRFENLFNGDKLLNDVVNETINKNVVLFLEELMPLIDKALAASFLVISNNIISHFTYDQLFP